MASLQEESFIPDINLSEYNYYLPEERIAQYPLAERDSSKLLVCSNGVITDDRFYNLAEHIPENSLLIFNDTRVIRARLLFRKESGAEIEIFCLEPVAPADYSLSLGSTYPVEWKCIAGNLKKWKSGTLKLKFIADGEECILSAEKTGSGHELTVKFSWSRGDLTFARVIEYAGHVPLPPYIKRGDEPDDAKHYQTIYSRIMGSVAAPTAGLHFTRRVLEYLNRRNVSHATITLHVGAGTFQPVKSERIAAHEMHSEHFFAGTDTIEKLYANLSRIIPVGTTSVRAIESLYWLGVRIIANPGLQADRLFTGQWEPYGHEIKISPSDALESLLEWMHRRCLDKIGVATRIIIVPGYRFRLTSGIITNFHQPGSTLLLLVSAWTGSNWKTIYDHALGNGYRFLSYGDASLLL